MTRSRKLRTRELAEVLGVAQATVRDWATAGVIPALRGPARGRWLFDQDEVLAALRRAGRAAEAKAAEPTTAA
jgi:excisionase family DNA binding protein